MDKNQNDLIFKTGFDPVVELKSLKRIGVGLFVVFLLTTILNFLYPDSEWKPFLLIFYIVTFVFITISFILIIRSKQALFYEDHVIINKIAFFKIKESHREEYSDIKKIILSHPRNPMTIGLKIIFNDKRKINIIADPKSSNLAEKMFKKMKIDVEKKDSFSL